MRTLILHVYFEAGTGMKGRSMVIAKQINTVVKLLGLPFLVMAD